MVLRKAPTFKKWVRFLLPLLLFVVTAIPVHADTPDTSAYNITPSSTWDEGPFGTKTKEIFVPEEVDISSSGEVTASDTGIIIELIDLGDDSPQVVLNQDDFIACVNESTDHDSFLKSVHNHVDHGRFSQRNPEVEAHVSEN